MSCSKDTGGELPARRPSQPIRVYVFHVSPPCRAVVLLLNYLGLEHEVIDTTREHMATDDFLKLNPMHTVPTIVDDDGFALSESRAILTYIISKYCAGGEHPLYPADARQRALIDARLYYDCGQFFRDVRAWVRPQLPVFGSHPPDAAAEKAMKVHFVNLERVLAGAEYMAGAEMSVADISVFATLAFLEIPGYELTAYPRLLGYVDRMRARLQPHYDAVNTHQLALIQRMRGDKTRDEH